MHVTHYNLLLADDDADDCMLFIDALEELPVSSKLTTVNNGVELMSVLKAPSAILPDVLFLDLNMPRKAGFECLSEIKLIENLKQLPVIVFSTSFNPEVVNLLYERGANYYIQKPGEFSKLKNVIHQALKLIAKKDTVKPSIEKFVISG